MLPLIAAGLGMQAVGFLGKLFGESDADKYKREQQERMKYLRSIIPGMKQKAITEGLTRISRQTKSDIAGGRQSASRRAMSLGRSADAESFIAPIEAEIAGRGVDAGRQYAENVGSQYDQALLNAETGFATDIPPIEPGLGDYAVELGSLATEYGQNEQLLGILGGEGNSYPGAFNPPETPSYGEAFPGGFEAGGGVPEFLEAGGDMNFYSGVEDRRNKPERALQKKALQFAGRF